MSTVVPYEEAARIRKIGSHEYACNVHPQYSWGPAAHGGFLIALVWRALGVHFSRQGSLWSLNQPDTIAFHIEFLRPTAVGDATIVLKDVRTGKGTSTVHASLVQGEKERCVVYATNAGPASALNTISIPMSPNNESPPIDFAAVLTGRDKNWIRHDMPFIEEGPVPSVAVFNYTFVILRKPHFGRNVTQYWITPRAPSQCWRTDMLGILFDLSIPPPEEFCPGTQHGYFKIVEEAQRNEREGRRSDIRPLWWGPRYYPTVNMSIEVKRQLPEEGVKWLAIRCETREVIDGRWDLDATCWDQKGRLIAIARSLNLVVEFERSTMGKVGKEGKVRGGGSKI